MTYSSRTKLMSKTLNIGLLSLALISLVVIFHNCVGGMKVISSDSQSILGTTTPGLKRLSVFIGFINAVEEELVEVDV